MRNLGLVTDRAGTLVAHDRMAEATADALGRLRVSGRRFTLVTGRRLDRLLTVCDYPAPFDSIVASSPVKT